MLRSSFNFKEGNDFHSSTLMSTFLVYLSYNKFKSMLAKTHYCNILLGRLLGLYIYCYIIQKRSEVEIMQISSQKPWKPKSTK